MQHMHNLLENTVDVLDILPPAELRYRAATVDQAVADATSELGRDIEVVQASRIRRGGVGGFFTTDLGVEIVVSPAPPRMAAGDFGGVDTPAPDQPTDQPAGRPGGRPYDRCGDLADEIAAGDVSKDSDVVEKIVVGEIDDATSFARHFAREMALEPVVSSAEAQPATHTAVRSGSDPLHTSRRATTPVIEEVTENVAEEATEGVAEKIAEPMSGAAKPRVRRDALRRPTELVAGAIDSLVTRLSATSPVDGSRLHDLHRLSVTLTTSDGDVIEMAAELRVR